LTRIERKQILLLTYLILIRIRIGIFQNTLKKGWNG